MDSIFEAVEGSPACTLSEELQDTLSRSHAGWKRAEALARMLGLQTGEDTPRDVLEATITDIPGSISPCPQHIRDEVRLKYNEALQFMSGLMGAM